MTTFRTMPADGGPLRVVVVGAGPMGRRWLPTVQESPEVDLAGIVDLDVPLAQAAAAELGVPDLPVGADLAAVAAASDAQAIIDATAPPAHLPVTVQALELGLPVLGEKPLAATLAEALHLVAAAERSGELFMVSQNYRYNTGLLRFREHARALGPLGVVTAEFFKTLHKRQVHEVMDHPLLLEMAIHTFDTARFLLDAEPVAVYCTKYNPSWSWFRGEAVATAIFEMTGGVRFVYTGSFCSPGLETSWNSAWRVSGERGSACWDGDAPPRLEVATSDSVGEVPAVATPAPANSIAGALAEFVHALRTGTTPMCEVHDNVLSLAMVEACVLSASTGRRVDLNEVLESAHATAVAKAEDDVRDVLRSWTSVSAALSPHRCTPPTEPLEVR
ncbi:Gfo/Idh/MocA family oxidoreductase [Kribbella sp. NPDC050820]|uniref:Gfo/Idh/MocA family protein n=1 Tax=Kribbella sp. NPDC050820 TaxID=3155408 RepID=UPI0033CD0B60